MYLRTSIRFARRPWLQDSRRKWYYYWGEVTIEWLIKRLIKIGARVSYHARKWHVHVASAFPLAHHYRAVLGYG